MSGWIGHCGPAWCRTDGPVWTTLLGTPSEIADALLAYKTIGVTQFIMSGWPELDEVITFGREVVPLVREAEAVLGCRT